MTTTPHYRTTEAIGYLLRQAHIRARARAETAMASEELDLTRWLVLMMLRDGLADTGSGLARCLGHDNGAMTRLIDQLADRALVVRDRSETDRRVVHVALTDTGTAAAERQVPRILALWDDLLDDFSPEEITTLRSLLMRLVNRLGTADAA